MHIIKGIIVSSTPQKTKNGNEFNAIQVLSRSDYAMVHKIQGSVVHTRQANFNGQPVTAVKLMCSAGNKKFMTVYNDRECGSFKVGDKVELYGLPVVYPNGNSFSCAFNSVTKDDYDGGSEDPQIITVSDFHKIKWEIGEKPSEIEVSFVCWKNGGGISYNVAKG